MPRRSQLFAPGGWSLVEFPEPLQCSGCWSYITAGWVNVVRESVLCVGCLDPYKHNGEEGIRAGDRIKPFLRGALGDEPPPVQSESDSEMKRRTLPDRRAQ